MRWPSPASPGTCTAGPRGALQLLLDRGQENDWFGATESWIEAGTGLFALAWFGAHTVSLPAGGSFIDYRLFFNRNFVTGLALIGLGLVFVPLSTATFATLEPAMYPQGTALFSLVRNLGSSIGISAVQALLVHNTTVAHASLAASLNETGLAAQATGGAATGLAALGLLDAEVQQQAELIAYLDDFKLMLALTLVVIPLLFLIRPARAPNGSAGEARR